MEKLKTDGNTNQEPKKVTPFLIAAVKAGKAEPGKYWGGDNLILNVRKPGRKALKAGRLCGSADWVHRYLHNGKSHWCGLGGLDVTSWQEAIEDNAATRKSRRREKIDPIEAKRADKAKQKLEAAKAITFDKCAAKYFKSHRAGWKSARHADQWETSLSDYATPIIGPLPVGAIDTALIMRVLEQDVNGATFWTARTETAARVRGRIETILDWAKVHGYREGENPARWKGHLDKLLPAKGKVAKIAHHAALPYVEMPGFMAALRAQEGIAPRALEFLVLTCARSGEALGAKWQEIDFRERTWNIPGERMKSGRPHRVPLSQRVLEILEELRPLAPAADAFIFPGQKSGRSTVNKTLALLLERLGQSATIHGFRSGFADWVTEQTNYPTEMREMSLAHAVGSKVEAAYRRTDLFERRRQLMQAWADYCAGEAGGKVIQLAGVR